MKRLFLLIAALSFSAALIAQTPGPRKGYQMFQNQLLKPKHGSEKKFEAAVKNHIAKFHAKGPHIARLSVVTTGTNSDGWYVFAMGPLMYPDLDHQPQGETSHDADWDNNIDPLIEQYGESTNWTLNDELSVTPPGYNPENIDVWTIDVKPGMRTKFSDLLKTMKTVWEQKKYPFSFRVFNNELFNSSGRDMAIVYSFKDYTQFDLDYKFKEDYEAVNGADSWKKFWETWNECTVSTDEHFRKFLN